MKRALIISVSIILIVIISFATVISYTSANKKTFYVGVTFCGSSVEDAKQLIDKVKDYTNLFVVQSDGLQSNIEGLTETCDYAVNFGLSVIVYFSTYTAGESSTHSFLDAAEERWGDKFLGVYLSDEPGGRMLDSGVPLHPPSTAISLIKQPGYYFEHLEIAGTHMFPRFYPSGEIIVDVDANNASYGYQATYFVNGTISYFLQDGNHGELFYQPDGTVEDKNGNKVTDVSVPSFVPYSQLWDSRLIKDYSDAAYYYMLTQEDNLDAIRNGSSVKLLTSDYGLYWWDYKGGYDTVLAQLGWNNTVAQEIGLVRGAANLQGKDWGTILTWKYTQAPYLPDENEMFEQMKASYEAGAKYVVIFNYAENMTEPYGTLQEEHFQALQRFWNEVVQNPLVAQGSINGEAALVLPKDYGWGMRNPQDGIWGIWRPDNVSQQIWTQLQDKLEQYGQKLDIVYDDPAFPVEGKYAQIYYWNQTG